jgi:EAL domain-containing protein (putative c-di-GMP-specific phosphodiesterase class I)
MPGSHAPWHARTVQRSAAVAAPAPRDGHAQDAFDTLRRLLRSGGPTLAFQPQLSLVRMEIAGYEALARFPDEAISDPQHWFSVAHDVGLGPALEACTIANALTRAHTRPAGTTLAINLSPSVLGSAPLRAVLPHDLSGFEIELTEHEVVLDPDGLRREIDRLRDRGARLAIDDVGAGHSGLRRVMDLAPDSLKLDRHLVDGVAENTAKAALIRAVVEFADHIGATVCAEGVETLADLLALADLDVAAAQGWVIGSASSMFDPPDPAVVEAGRASMRRVLAPPPMLTAAGSPPPALDDLLARLTDVRTLAALAQLARSAAGSLDCSRVELSYLYPDGTAVEALIGDDPDVRGGSAVPVPYPVAAFPLTRQCIEERCVIPVYPGDVGASAERGLLAELGYSSVLLLPVSSRGRVVGLLECYRGASSGERAWSRRVIRSARLLASGVGPVLDALLREADDGAVAAPLAR